MNQIIDAARHYKGINLLKIGIVCFVGITMILFFDPYYERTEDSYFYGVSAINTANGNYAYSNELLQNSESREFVPSQWLETIHGEAVPVVFGRAIISTGVFGAFGFYGLFYFGPIATIALLVISERITTKLFGGMVGLITLLFLATSELILYVGRVLLTDNFFTIFLMIGIFYLIKFYKEKKENYIIFASAFFAFSAFIRINGMILLPIELFIVGLVLWKHNRLTIPSSVQNKAKQTVGNIKKYTIVAGKVSFPWLILLVVIFSYNSYFFGDPTQSALTYDSRSSIDRGFVNSLSKTEPAERMDNFLRYANSILPSPINRIQPFAENYDQRLDEYYPAISSTLKPLLSDGNLQFNFGIISVIVIGIAIFAAIKTRQNFFEIVLYSAIIFSFLFVFSKSFVVDRYMLPLLPMFFAMIGYLIVKPFSIKRSSISILASKSVLVVVVGVFFVFAFYLSEPVQILKVEGTDITNPAEKANRYPLDKEGLSENSIVIGVLSSKTIDYGFIPFNPIYEHPKKIEFDQKYVIPESIDLIITLIKDGHEFYVFKEPQSHLDKQFLKYLVENYQFVLKDHSSSFCKLYLEKNDEQQSDELCFLNKNLL